MLEELQVLEREDMRVLTTPQIAKLYGTTRKIISYNFQYNKKKYVEGKHYIKLEGSELSEFKSCLDGQDSLKYAHTLYLWTEKGALLHAKSLNTDKAWEVYDYLVDFYFRVKEQTEAKKPVTQVSNPNMRTVVDVPENPKILEIIQKIRDDLTTMDVLLNDCTRYLSEETYEERKKAAADVVHILIGDLHKLLDTKPKLIQKRY